MRFHEIVDEVHRLLTKHLADAEGIDLSGFLDWETVGESIYVELANALGLTEEQKRVVDRVITANNHFGAVYGGVAYRVGMEDGIGLRMEIE